jgi:hypothetical protein
LIELVVETAIGTALTIVIAYLSYLVYSTKRANRDLALLLMQANLETELVTQKLDKTIQTLNNTNIEDKDGFIKFLSQSREWAFGYIEDVQNALKEMSAAMDAADEKRILEAYDKLMKYMPEEINNN